MITLVIFMAALSVMIHNAQFLIKLALLSNVGALSVVSLFYDIFVYMMCICWFAFTNYDIFKPFISNNVTALRL